MRISSIIILLVTLFIENSVYGDCEIPKQYLKDSEYRNFVAYGCYSMDNKLKTRESLYSDNVKVCKCITSAGDTTTTFFDEEGRVVSIVYQGIKSYKLLTRTYKEDTSSHYVYMNETNNLDKDTIIAVWNEKGLIHLWKRNSDTLVVFKYTDKNKVSVCQNNKVGIIDSFFYQQNGDCIDKRYIKSNDNKWNFYSQFIYDKHGFIYERAYMGKSSLVNDVSKDKFEYTYYCNGFVKSRRNECEYCKYSLLKFCHL